MPSPKYASDATSIGESNDRLEAEGFTGQFGAAEGGLVRCYSCHSDIPAAEVELTALRRTEGASDPDDMAAVAAITCPNCGTKGTLVLKYGAIASVEEDDVLILLEDRRDRSTGGVSSPDADQ